MAAKDEGKKKFKLFGLGKDGRGISKKASELGTGLKRFFVSYKNNFDKILYCNIFMVLGNFPVLFLIIALAGYTQDNSSLPMYDLFQNLVPFFSENVGTPFGMTVYALAGIQNQILVPTTLTYVFYGIGALTLVTFGLVNVGTAYILRNIAMGEPVFTWYDFWYAIKRNWKQALPFGIIDVLINAVLIFNIYNMMMTEQNFFESTMMWMNVVILILYFFMRPYIYVQMVTFNLSVFKMIKNSMIFALLGIKRNLLALLGILVGVVVEVILVFGVGGILLPLGVAAPLAILFSSFAYMKVFAAYYKIKEVMVDPYKAEHPEEFAEEEFDEEDIIMRDDVTERERLEEIKARMEEGQMH
ncbi:MAG: hypothetical protein IKC87_06060 [Clostridia bacterium]|nr:hypothetical protein [Clostridia bacterium]